MVVESERLFCLEFQLKKYVDHGCLVIARAGYLTPIRVLAVRQTSFIYVFELLSYIQ
jgi:hypothetical protein